jgi:hypothetical protein
MLLSAPMRLARTSDDATYLATEIPAKLEARASYTPITQIVSQEIAAICELFREQSAFPGHVTSVTKSRTPRGANLPHHPPQSSTGGTTTASAAIPSQGPGLLHKDQDRRPAALVEPGSREAGRTPWARRAGGTATGIRTPVSAVRGRRPSPLDDGGPSVGDCSGRFLATLGAGYDHAVHRPVVEGSPVRSRRGPATVNGR